MEKSRSKASLKNKQNFIIVKKMWQYLYKDGVLASWTMDEDFN
jgi:hypothetical protein